MDYPSEPAVAFGDYHMQEMDYALYEITGAAGNDLGKPLVRTSNRI